MAKKQKSPELGVIKGSAFPANVDGSPEFNQANDVAKQERIKKALDELGKVMEAEGVKYFAGAVDKNPKAPDGGKAYVQSDITGTDFCYILDLALPTNQDLINVGIYVGQVIQARNKKVQTLKGN